MPFFGRRTSSERPASDSATQVSSNSDLSHSELEKSKKETDKISKQSSVMGFLNPTYSKQNSDDESGKNQDELAMESIDSGQVSFEKIFASNNDEQKKMKKTSKKKSTERDPSTQQTFKDTAYLVESNNDE